MGRATSTTLILLLAGAVLAGATAATAETIPDRPEQLRYEPLSFDLPDAGAMRFELSNGTPVYAISERQLPLVTLTIHFRGGQYLEAPGKEGLTTITADVWRSGGAGDRSAQELDEELDFLAAEVSTELSQVKGTVRLDVLSKDLPAAMTLLMDLLTRPRFQEDRFNKAREDLIQDMKTRNDSSARIEARVWSRLIYGDDFWLNRLPTKASVESISAEDCRRLVTRLIRADNMVLAVTGDFERTELKQLLDQSIGSLAKLDTKLPPVPQPEHRPEPGVYLVNKTEVNQGRVSLGHRGGRLGDPDEFALRLMAEIMGGGTFTSRTMKRVRSDEGLTYGAYARYSLLMTFPGVFRANFQSKFSTCPFGIELIADIIKDMRAENVTAEELATARNIHIEQFPRSFESPEKTANLFAVGELLGRPEGYWASYRDKISSVSADEIRKAAATHLHPDELVVLVVGDVEELQKGHPDHDAKLTDLGELKHIRLRDPLTLEPLPQEPLPQEPLPQEPLTE